jgi:putative transposase
MWVTDITEHPTREGKVYCAVVLDVYSRRVVGWSIRIGRRQARVDGDTGSAQKRDASAMPSHWRQSFRPP